MEAAALYAFATANGRRVLCLVHVTKGMGQTRLDFDKGEVDSTAAQLDVLEPSFPRSMQPRRMIGAVWIIESAR